MKLNLTLLQKKSELSALISTIDKHVYLTDVQCEWVRALALHHHLSPDVVFFVHGIGRASTHCLGQLLDKVDNEINEQVARKMLS